jgi:antitoxin YokJ
MQDLIQEIENISDCFIHPASGIPAVDLLLPSDLSEFYKLCGGCDLFTQKDYKIKIVPPSDFISSNLKIVNNDKTGDISDFWYIVGDSYDGNYISIDLHPDRLGRCYDSFWDSHGIIGSCAIVALNFTDLLSALIKNKGEYWYWLSDGFSLGDAYS